MDATLGTPNACLYVNNLNEKVNVDVLKKMFNMLFSQYGKVISIVAYSTLKTKGQAWVLFEDEKAATAAMKGKQGFNFYDKPLRIQYARGLPKGEKTSATKRSGDHSSEILSGNQDAQATKRARKSE
jgi:RNA recognition motif-containing protein